MVQGVKNIPTGGALHVTWKFPFADSVSVRTLHGRLISGQRQHLFDIRLWDCRDGQVTAVLAPEAPFDEIVALIQSTGYQPESLWQENSQEPEPT
jgi:hypothetical protein